MAWNVVYCNLDLGTGDNDGSSEANAWKTLSDLIGGYAAGDHIHVTGTETLAQDTDITFATAGTVDNAVWFEGYDSSPGDGGTATIVFDNANHSSQSMILTGENLVFGGFDISGPAKGGLVYVNNGYGIKFIRSTLSNTGSVYLGYSLLLTGSCECYQCTFKTAGTAAAIFVNNASSGVAYGCLFDVTGSAVEMSGNNKSISVIGCILIGDGGATDYGISLRAASSRLGLVFAGNTIYNFGHGIHWVNSRIISSLQSVSIINNIFSTCLYGLYNADVTNNAGWPLVAHNAYHAITTAQTYGFTDIVRIGEVTLTEDPFTTIGFDFALNNTAGGGADCKSVGAPTDIDLDGSQDNWLDIGALQVEPSAGGSGGVIPMIGGQGMVA